MPSRPSAPTDRLALLERLVVGSVSATARALADAAPELSLLQWRVLVVLTGETAGATVTEVAERIGSQLPATSRLVGRMRAHGLVETRKDHPDARLTTVVATPQGESLWRRVAQRRRELLAAALDGAALTPGDDDALARLAAAFEAFR